MRAALAVTLLTVAPLLACDKPKARNVQVSVIVILASEKDGKVDKKLEAIATEVRKTHPSLKGFRLEKMACQSLEVGKADEFELVDTLKVAINILGAADKMDRVRLDVEPPGMGKVKYTTPCGKFLPILTPFKTTKGEQVLIAIRVQPCSGK